MRIQITKTIFLTIILFGILGLAQNSLAAPSVSGLVGTANHGNSITINGSGFGTKTSAAPILWDNFDNGINGEAIGNGWTSFVLGGGLNPIYSNSITHQGSGLSCMTRPRHSGSQNQDSAIRRSFNGQLTDHIFLSFWLRYSTGTVTGQIKTFRIDTNYYDDDSSWSHISQFNHLDMSSHYFQRKPTGGSASTFNLDPEWPNEEWVLVEIEIDQASDAAGSFVCKSSSVSPIATVASISNIATINQYDEIMLGQYVADGGTDIYYDDIYVDNTWQRIVIGDASTYANCTKREIQPPTAWSETSSTITLNQGSFVDDETAYLYVVDENGEVNEAGYPITFGQEYAETPIVSGVIVPDGTISDGNSITISGTGFGEKATAAPFKYDNFESYTAGNNVTALNRDNYASNPQAGIWYNYQNDGAAIPRLWGTVSDTYAHNGSKSLGKTTIRDGNEYWASVFTGGLNAAKVYCSAWIRVGNLGGTGGDAGTVFKGFRIASTGGNDSNKVYRGCPRLAGEMISNITENYISPNPYDSIESDGCPNGGSAYERWAIGAVNFEQWVRIESYAVASTDSDTGQMREWYNLTENAALAALNPFATVQTEGLKWDTVIAPIAMATSSSSVGPWQINADDIYIDTTPARVEIGDASTWSACAHREIQIPSAWDGSITATINQGSFTDGETAYLYVVDENGEVNEAGYPITFGGSSDTTAPSTPSGLSVS